MNVTLAPTPAQYAALAKTASAYPPAFCPPSTFVRNISVRAFSLGMSSTQILVYLRSQKQRPGLSDLLANRQVLKRLLSSANRYVTVSSSPAAADANLRKLSELIWIRVFQKIGGTPQGKSGKDLSDEEWAASITEPLAAVAPKPATAATQLRTRVGLAVVANELAASLKSERAFNTTLLSYSRMNLVTGWTTSTSKRALNELVDRKLIGELKSALKARARRFKITGKVRRNQRQLLRDLDDAVGQFAGVEGPDSLAATILANVSHPAWNYAAGLGHKTWWIALVDAAGQDPVELGGMTKRNVALARKAMTEAGLDTTSTSPEFMSALDTYATANGGWEAKRQAEQNYAEQAEARAVEIRTHQGYKLDALKILDKHTGITAKIPALDRAAKFSKWLTTSTEAFTGIEMPAALVAHLHTLLVRRIARRTGGGQVASSVASWILAGVKVDGELPAKRKLQIRAARGLDRLGVTLESIPAGGVEELEQKRFLKVVQEKLASLPAQSEEMQAGIAADLLARLTVRGWDADKAAKGSAWAVRDMALIEVEKAA